MIVRQSENLVQEAFRKAVLQSNQHRKDDAVRALDLYNNDQVSHILAQIQKFYKTPEKISPVGINIVRKIVRALSTVYLQDATRIVTGSVQDQAIFSAVEDSAALPVRMKLANRYARLLGTILLRPVWRNGALDLDVLTPDILDVVTGDSPEDLLAVMITLFSDTGKANEIQYSFWTPETVQRLNYRFQLIAEEPNPYSVLPFIPVHATPPTNEFWQSGANDLVNVQEAINKRLTDLWHTLDFQSAGVFYVKGAKLPGNKPGVANITGIEIGPGSIVQLPESGELGFAAPQAPVQDTLEAIEKLMKWAAITNGLPAGSMSLTPTEQSGISRIIANSELEELRRDDIAIFARVERQLFEVIRTVWNVHNPQEKISESASLLVDFYDPKPVVSATEQIAEWKGLLELGLISPTDILLERNPDLSRADAKAELLRIRDELTEFQNTNFAYPA